MSAQTPTLPGEYEDLLLRRRRVFCSRPLRLCPGACFRFREGVQIPGREEHQARTGSNGFPHVQLHHTIQKLQLQEAFHQGLGISPYTLQALTALFVEGWISVISTYRRRPLCSFSCQKYRYIDGVSGCPSHAA